MHKTKANTAKERRKRTGETAPGNTATSEKQTNGTLLCEAGVQRNYKDTYSE